MRRQYADLKVDDLRTGDLQGHHRLRRTLSIRLALQRGIVCSPEQVFVTAGLQGAMALITEAVLSAGEAVIVEDPGDPKCREALRRAGARLVPAAVDENGMRVDQALSSAPEARLALVMPSAQFPLGVALSGGRRERLLKWARGSGAWIVERDLHSHFRFAGTPAPALASQDRHGRVLYTIDFSDILFPGLRLGCVVVPPEQVERFRGAVARIALQPGWSDQAALAEFIRFGHIGRYLARSLEVCRRRRQALLEAIAKVSPSTAVYAPDAGLHLLVALDHPLTDASRARLHAFGLAPTPMTTCAPSESAQPTLLVGFGSTPVHAAEHAIAAMLEALRSPPRA
ncbi:MAG: PLP-dependent aminotransferase family protein [Lautropia sp.]